MFNKEGMDEAFRKPDRWWATLDSMQKMWVYDFFLNTGARLVKSVQKFKEEQELEEMK